MIKTPFGGAKWIVPQALSDVKPINIFHREQEKTEIVLPEELKNLHLLYKKQFSLDIVPNDAVIRITADDYYKLSINGKFVGMGPAQGYFFDYHFNEYDISDYLTAGENEITVDVYYQGLVNHAYCSGDRRMGLVAGIFLNGDFVFGTASDWESTVSGAYTISHTLGYDTAFAENYDMRVKDRDYKHSVEINTDYTFSKAPTTSLSVYEKSPVSVSPLACGGALYDFGELVTGGLTIRAVGHAGDKVRILSGEELEETIPEQVRFDMRCGCLCEEFLTLDAGENEYTQYEYKGFRYAAVIPENGALITDVTAVVRHYPFDDDHCTLETASEILRSVWRICKNSVKYGTQEVYVDCPTREKGQYSGDMVITSAAQIILTGDTSMLKKAIDEQMNSAVICDALMAVTPSSVMQEIADYSLQFPILALRYYSYTGDKDYLVSNLKICQKILGHYAKFARKDGLVEDVTDQWNLVDWPQNLRDGYDFKLTRPMRKGSGCHNVINAFYIGCVMKTEEIMDILNIPYENKSRSLIKAFNDEFYSEEAGLYTDSHISSHSALHSNVIPLYYGISADKDEQRIADFIMEKKLTCGVYMAYFVLKALCRVKRYEDALSLITSEDENSWYNMVREGADCCFEAWGKDKKWNTSLCHPWACAPISVLAEDILPNMPHVGTIKLSEKA